MIFFTKESDNIARQLSLRVVTKDHSGQWLVHVILANTNTTWETHENESLVSCNVLM